MADAKIDEYDPHAERVHLLKRPTNDIETLFHMIKGILGTGILAMPEAFKYVGFVTGVLGTALVGSALTYSMHKLIRAEYQICKRKRVPALTYGFAMRYALEIGPQWGRKFSAALHYITDTFLLLNQAGCCCIYVIFIGRNSKFVLDHWTGVDLALEIYILVAGLLCMMVLMIRDLKYLAPFTIVATLVQLCVFGIVGYYIATDLPKFCDKTVLFVGPLKIPIFLGTTVFALIAMGVFVSAEYNMKNPKSFHKVLNIAMIFCTVLYGAVGFFGYWRYEDKTEPSVTLNLPKNHLAVHIVIIGYCLCMIVTYGLQGYCGFEILWYNYKKIWLKEIRNLTGWEYLTRFELFAGTFAFGITIPLLGLIISLVGSFCLACLGIVFPALMELCVIHPNYGKYKWELIKNLLIIFFGIIAFLSGTYCCVLEITQKMLQGEL